MARLVPLRSLPVLVSDVCHRSLREEARHQACKVANFKYTEFGAMALFRDVVHMPDPIVFSQYVYSSFRYVEPP